MAGIMSSVDQRTQLAGHNRMELLLFRFEGRQRYGINVFKVREVIPAPELSYVPHAHPASLGIAYIRGHTLSVLDLSYATGNGAITKEEGNYIIVTEYNRQVQGFLVGGVDRIVNINWQDVLPPPSGGSAGSYLTAVARYDGQMIQIVDVEKVLAEVQRAGGADPEVTEGGGVDHAEGSEAYKVLVVDDSAVARGQIKRTLEEIGVRVVTKNNGREALEQLRTWKDQDPSGLDDLLMVVSDIEMPVLDGYTLTRSIRQDPGLAGVHVLLHSSLSGVFNTEMVRRVGADEFLAKFHSRELAERVGARLAERGG
ncbi:MULTISPECIES: chemotaxis protein CheV [unclassified Halorhodospira]|uniref:chemotaxis protein CheV n=1 Tax=unclassified Halorhodospira TaxID=2626748 RepID=UPI001EE7F319|nr:MULTISPECIES: chemotaxis protein CheV [unclassified Halorhodospira]MCG5541129.1 chemotaxis protein CheV [Halorhodospira sp. M39old]MCG5545588.1 chemotaxis protein CheV [Halorhodospira sp. M38]